MAEWQYTRITSRPEDVGGRYNGIRDQLPEGDNIRGDSVVQRINGELVIKAWNGYSWETLENSGLSNEEKSEISAKAMRDVLEAVGTGTVTSSEYGYFRTLIAGTVTAEFIKSQRGVFNDIVVSGESYFYGNFNCPTIESMPNTEGVTELTCNVPAFSGSSQIDALDTFWSTNALQNGKRYEIVSSTLNERAKFIRRIHDSTRTIYEFTDSIENLTFEVFIMGIYSGSRPTYDTDDIAKKSFDFTVKIAGGETILKLKGLQSGPDGLQNNQVYYTIINGHKVLCLR